MTEKEKRMMEIPAGSMLAAGPGFAVVAVVVGRLLVHSRRWLELVWTSSRLEQCMRVSELETVLAPVRHSLARMIGRRVWWVVVPALPCWHTLQEHFAVAAVTVRTRQHLGLARTQRAQWVGEGTGTRRCPAGHSTSQSVQQSMLVCSSLSGRDSQLGVRRLWPVRVHH
jgi:hypothetical protein